MSSKTPLHQEREHHMSKATPYLMLVSRPILFLLVQISFALVFFFSGDSAPWISASKYWILFPVFTNIVSIALLRQLYKAEGKSYIQRFSFKKDKWYVDLIITIGVFAIAFPLAMLPNTFLAQAIFKSQEITANLLFQKIPLWAVIVGFLWPLTHPFAELPTYFDYCMNRLTIDMKSEWKAYALSSLALAFQHITLPLIFDYRYLLWRFGMFLALAFFVGLCIKLRPRLFPYIVIGHGLLDLPIVLIFLSIS
jgi:hypothetical protein